MHDAVWLVLLPCVVIVCLLWMRGRILRTDYDKVRAPCLEIHTTEDYLILRDAVPVGSLPGRHVSGEVVPLELCGHHYEIKTFAGDGTVSLASPRGPVLARLITDGARGLRRLSIKYVVAEDLAGGRTFQLMSVRGSNDYDVASPDGSVVARVCHQPRTRGVQLQRWRRIQLMAEPDENLVRLLVLVSLSLRSQPGSC